MCSLQKNASFLLQNQTRKCGASSGLKVGRGSGILRVSMGIGVCFSGSFQQQVLLFFSLQFFHHDLTVSGGMGGGAHNEKSPFSSKPRHIVMK